MATGGRRASRSINITRNWAFPFSFSHPDYTHVHTDTVTAWVMVLIKKNIKKIVRGVKETVKKRKRVSFDDSFSRYSQLSCKRLLFVLL